VKEGVHAPKREKKKWCFMPEDYPTMQAPVEHRHNANTKSLADLRMYQTAPVDGGRHTTSIPSSPSKICEQPITQKHQPHLAHHHHYGWNPPTPQVGKNALDCSPVFLLFQCPTRTSLLLPTDHRTCFCGKQDSALQDGAGR
jgi:hypothetical protein